MPRVVLRYAMAVVLACAAALFTYLLRGIGDAGVTPLFFAAVLLSAWYGGLGPGLIATLLSGVATGLLLLKGRPVSLGAIQDHLLRVGVFSIVSILASSLHVAMQRASEASEAARESAEAASAAKSRFLAMVSHELRTPLSPVLMIADLLERDPDLSSRVKEDIRVIRRNVDLEIRLIDDLVDLTRISSGKMQLKRDVVDVHGVLQSATEVCQQDLRDKHLTLVTHCCAHDPLIHGDPVRLQQIFWNLLRNAIKFTPDGGRITVTSQNTANTLSIEVSDTGIGIEPQRLQSIFQAFEQGGPDIQMRFGGLGLGLAICQALVEAHNGSILACSAGPGQGARFIVTLPLANLSSAAQGATAFAHQ